jgi:hypothetical protein
MQIDLSQVTQNKTISINVNVIANMDTSGKLIINSSQSVNNDDHTGNIETDSTTQSFKGTHDEVIVKLTSVGLNSFVV